jgi:hypothetical protein
MATSAIIKRGIDVVFETMMFPLLFGVAIVNFFPNPLRYLLYKTVEETYNIAMPSAMVKGHLRKIMIAVDETSHEAVNWALSRLLEPGKDHVVLVYLPEGDYRGTYKKAMRFTNYDWMDKLPGADFLWEYCEKLDLSQVRINFDAINVLKIEFECMIMYPVEGSGDVASSIIATITKITPELVVMGSSKRHSGYKF